jgi:integrase
MNREINTNQPQSNSPDKIHDYAKASLSDNTWKAYEYDLADFYDWGGEIPCAPDMIASYIAALADTKTVATIKRRLASLHKAHRLKSHASPIKSDIVQMTMKGIQRKHGSKQRQAKPLLRDDLVAILNMMGSDPAALRDRALLLIGFAGALRRSEITALNKDDIEFVKEGLILHIRKSKTDQQGFGRKIAIPFGRSRICPVKALQAWMMLIADDDNPVLFRSIRKGGIVLPDRLSNHAVSVIVKKHAQGIGLDSQNYSGHSLRSGFVTSAAQAGIPEWRIMKQSGHKSHQTMMRYVRDARLFEDHPLDTLF